MSGEINYRQRIETLEKKNAEHERRISNLEGANRVLNDRILTALESHHSKLVADKDQTAMDLRD